MKRGVQPLYQVEAVLQIITNCTLIALLFQAPYDVACMVQPGPTLALSDHDERLGKGNRTLFLFAAVVQPLR
jgi:hypothetical protein